MSAGKQKMEMPVPRSREGWLTANVGGMRVLNLLGFLLCGARFERDIYEKGKFKGRVKYAHCSRGGEYAKMTMYVCVEYDDGDVQKFDLEQLTACSWRMDGMLRQELIGQVILLENGLNAVVRIFEQQQFRVVLQKRPVSYDGFGINEVVMSLQEVMTCLIRFWQKEFVRLVGIERVSDPFVKTVEDKEANNGTEVEAQRNRQNGSQGFFNQMYDQMAENSKMAQDATDKVNQAVAAAQRNHEAPQTCSVCLVEKVNQVLIPCGHIVLCGGCADMIIAVAPRRCPICREEIVWSHYVVFPS
jgi:rubrerythrin